MAKLLGFYTVEVKNMETGAIQSKADLLIMENLFYKRKISQTFDLKGIEYVHWPVYLKAAAADLSSQGQESQTQQQGSSEQDVI